MKENWLDKLVAVTEKTHLMNDEIQLVEKAKKYWLKDHPSDYEGADLSAKGALVAYHLILSDPNYYEDWGEEGEELDYKELNEFSIDNCAHYDGARFVKAYRENKNNMRFAVAYMELGDYNTVWDCLEAEEIHEEEQQNEDDDEWDPESELENMFPDGMDDGFDVSKFWGEE